jgi:hypothetical protein
MSGSCADFARASLREIPPRGGISSRIAQICFCANLREKVREGKALKYRLFFSICAKLRGICAKFARKKVSLAVRVRGLFCAKTLWRNCGDFGGKDKGEEN